MSERKKLESIQLNSHQALRDIVYTTLREAIRSGVLCPGDRLMEIQVAKELGVSRTPVREASRRLEAEGLVVMVPRRGTYVSSMSLRDINDVFEIREALETLAAGLAAERITDEELEGLERIMVTTDEMVQQGDLNGLVEMDIRFHEKIYEASRNIKLVQILSNLREQTTTFRTQTIASPGRMQKTLEEHRSIVEALGDRDLDGASRTMQDHLSNAEGALLEFLETGESGNLNEKNSAN